MKTFWVKTPIRVRGKAEIALKADSWRKTGCADKGISIRRKKDHATPQAS